MQKYPSETQIILALKREGYLSLNELAERIGISKMAVLNHMQKLESQGLVERRLVKTKVGRPYYTFGVSENSKSAMAPADSSMLDEFVEYLDSNGHSGIVTEFLRERYGQVRLDYEKKLSRVAPDRKVEELAKLREQENYFPELKSGGKDSYELLEYNCPIFNISRKFGIACSLETQLFSSVLDREVTSTHRQVDGSDVCKFLIRKKTKD